MSMKMTIYILVALILLGTIGYFQNEYTRSLANRVEKHPYIHNIKKSLGFD